MTTDGEHFLLLCVENHLNSGSYPKTRASASLPAGTSIGPVIEVHIVKILDEYGLEVAIPSICKPGNITCVVISRETERFVNENHNHKEEFRSSNELLGNLQELERNASYEERKVTTPSKETSAAPSKKETRAGFLSLIPNKASLYTRRTIPTNEEKWITVRARSRYGGDLAVSISKTFTTMLRHFDREERQSDGARHWDSIKAILVRKFAHEGARDFSDGAWLQKMFEGSTKKENRILQR